MKILSYVILCCLLVNAKPAPGQVLPIVSTLAWQNSAVVPNSELSQKEIVTLFLASSAQFTNASAEPVISRLHTFCVELKQNKEKASSEKRFLEFVFSQTHAQFLHQYESYPPFQKLLTDGTYNCVTGSALYTLIYTQLGYEVKIYETALHAYIKVKAGKREYLIDATDKAGGFVGGRTLIQQRENFYAANERKKHQPFFNREISLSELCGLAYYNEATLKFNKRNYDECSPLLEQAAQLYSRSERIQNLRYLTAQRTNQLYTMAVGQKSKK